MTLWGVSQVCGCIKSMPWVVNSSSCTSIYNYRNTLFTEITYWVYSKFKNKVWARRVPTLKYFPSSKHCMKFQGKENTTTTEDYELNVQKIFLEMLVCS